jgi:hypothetical protein
MTTNGGGYTLVVGVDATNRNHVTTAAVTPQNLTTAIGKGKLSDAVIRALLATGSSELRWDVSGAASRAWTSPTCVWDATAPTCTNHCGPDDPCKYVQPTAIGLYEEVATGTAAIFSYASGGCLFNNPNNDPASFPGSRNWMGDECGFSTAVGGTVWVR